VHKIPQTAALAKARSQPQKGEMSSKRFLTSYQYSWYMGLTSYDFKANLMLSLLCVAIVLWPAMPEY
jgi:hypothetical protein